MEGIEGLYTNIKAIIREQEDESKLACEVSSIVKEVRKRVDVYSASVDWYIETTLKLATSVCLNQLGYRSVVKGDGLYVQIDNCKKPEYLKRLFNNAKLDERQKEMVVAMLTQKIISEVPGQMSIDFETGLITEDISTDQLIEMLKEDARIA